MLFPDNWDELLKSHKYSRKEFKDGAWRYYYDKNDNFSRMTRCKAKPLPVSNAMTREQIVEAAENYLRDVWIADWKGNGDKAICKELKGKTIAFDDISFKHIGKRGGNSPQGPGVRSKKTF